MSFLPAEPKRPHESGGIASRKKSRTAPEKPITTEEAIAAIRKDWKIVKMIRKKDKKYAKFLQDKDVVKEIVGMNHTMLRYMPEAARDQKGIVYDAVCAMNENEDEVSMHPTAFQWASDRLKNDVDFVREIRQMMLESVNSKRTIQTFDSFVPEAVLRQVEPVSPHWLEKSIETGDFELFKTQESIIPKQREPLVRKLCDACLRYNPSGPQLANYRQIFVALTDGEYGERSLARLGASNSTNRGLFAEWLLNYAGDDIFQDIWSRLRFLIGSDHRESLASDIAKNIGYQLGKPQTIEQIKQFGTRLMGITFGLPGLVIKVYTMVMKSIRKFSTRNIHNMMDAAHAGDDIPAVPEQSTYYDQIVVTLLQRLVTEGRPSLDTNPRGYILSTNTLGYLLSTAIDESYPKAAHYLLQNGADPNWLAGGLRNISPLIEAVNKQNVEMIELLLSNGANMRQDHGQSNRTALMLSPSLLVTQCLLAHGPNLDEVDNKGYTALHLAVEKGYADIATELLRRGANPNIANIFGRTAAFKAVNNLSIECARELFNPRYGVDINHQDTQNLNTVLHCLAKHNPPPARRQVGAPASPTRTIFTLIMARNPDLSLLNKEDRTALRCSRSPLMSKLLVSVGCGAKWAGAGDWDDARNLFKDLPASTFDDSPVVLRLQEDEMQGDDRTVAPVRLGCEHVFNATFLRQWLNTNRYGYEGSATQFKTACPMCRKEITNIELLSSAKAANWDNFEGLAKVEEYKLDTALKKWDKTEDYKQKKAAVDAAADALKAAQELLKVAEDATREKERERREIRDASDVKQKAFRDRRLLEQLKDLGL